MLRTQATQKAVAWLKSFVMPKAKSPEGVQAVIDALAEQPNLVNVLRACADQLKKVGGATFFPGWDIANEPSLGHEAAVRNEQIRRAAGVIYASGTGPNSSTEVAHVALATLIHYIADMLEGTIVAEFAAEEPEEAEFDPAKLARIHRRENLAYAQAGMRSRSGETEWWLEAVHDLARNEEVAVQHLLGDLYSAALAISRLEDVPRVCEDAACPGCSERRVDELVWQDDGATVQCGICGCKYTPPASDRPLTA